MKDRKNDREEGRLRYQVSVKNQEVKLQGKLKGNMSKEKKGKGRKEGRKGGRKEGTMDEEKRGKKEEMRKKI